VNKHFVSNKDESVRMFRSDLLEKFTKVHPIVPHVLFVPVVVFFLWTSTAGLGAAVLLFLAGVLLWTFVEYIMHRFVFHAPDHVMEETHDVVAGLVPGEAVVPKLPTWRHTFYFIAHGVHHDYPSDSKRLVMPPGVSVPLAIAFWFLFKGVFGATLAPALFAGFVTGYLIYDTIHFAVHHFSVPTKAGRFLKRKHHRHHFLDPDEDYGVSSPLWDLVLGTFGRAPARKAGGS
jgi:sterol desaturase/sphingolipid hydroxylase (fatty acid hydroxylase superfamily)